jgi:hypothetical protein
VVCSGGRLSERESPEPSKVWAVAVAQVWALFPDRRPATDPYPVRSGIYGIAWKFMVVNGILTIALPTSWGFLTPEARLHLLKPHARDRRHDKLI